MIVSASLGALIGTIRQWNEQRERSKDDGSAGLRTFALWALIGTVSAFISDQHFKPTFVIALTLVGGQVILRSVVERSEFRVGFTSAAVAILTFLVGGLVHWGHTQPAVMLAALTVLLAGLKQPIHGWTRRFSDRDIRSTLQFVAITGVILPLVPDKGYGPYAAFNPYSMWLMVVLISGLGFVGYLLMRLLGPQAGIVLSGVVGGLASSTATTLAFSRQSREDPVLSGSYALAVVLACTVMLGRVAAVLGTLNPGLFAAVWVPLAIMSVPGLGYAGWMLIVHRKGRGASKTLELANPLSLGMAVKFALIYGVVTLLVKAVSQSEVTTGLLAVSFVSGLTDVDAIALSMVDSVRTNSLLPPLAAKAIVMAAVANTIMKAGMAVALGSPVVRRNVGIVLGLTATSGIAAVLTM
ncbi:MAG TPA: hypothetical protein DCY13_00665 [Verrucomicrobiales bacterium]|nr:hypothetical protein [Verrucomicrobiales bacterium]